jgi:hypothetical protein
MTMFTNHLFTLRIAGHAGHWSVVPQLAPLLYSTLTYDEHGTNVIVKLRRPTHVVGTVPIAQGSDGSITSVTLLRSPRGLLALSARYAATYTLAQPFPFRAAVLEHWLHVYRSDAFEVALALRLLLAQRPSTAL